MSDPLLDPIRKPDIIVPDATPLIHLALVGQLGLLHAVGGAVILVDVVADEAVRHRDKPGATEIAAWIEAGQRPGSNAPVRIALTETGRAIVLARRTDPAFHAPNAGEAAIVEWLATTVQGSDDATIVIYENGRVPAIVANQAIDADIDVVTTRAFLDLAERRGLIESASRLWADVIARAPTANPAIRTAAQRRPRA